MTHQQAAVQAAAAADSRCVMNFEHFIKKEMEPQDYMIFCFRILRCVTPIHARTSLSAILCGKTIIIPIISGMIMD